MQGVHTVKLAALSAHALQRSTFKNKWILAQGFLEQAWISFT